MEMVAIPGAIIEVTYIDPFGESTSRQSQAWYNLRALYLSFKVSLEITREKVPVADIQRNPKDDGKWRWDTPLFDKEVGELVDSIRSTGKFEAVWLSKQDGIYSLLDGHHRVTAWQRMGDLAVPSVVVIVTPRESAFQFQ